MESNLAEGIAAQIRAMRDRQRMNQSDLARAAGMSQNNLSRLENPDYGKYTLSSLKRIAHALDVALVVRFVPFSQYISWLSGTSHFDNGLTPHALSVPNFEDEESDGTLESSHVPQFFSSATLRIEAQVSVTLNTTVAGGAFLNQESSTWDKQAALSGALNNLLPPPRNAGSVIIPNTLPQIGEKNNWQFETMVR